MMTMNKEFYQKLIIQLIAVILSALLAFFLSMLKNLGADVQSGGGLIVDPDSTAFLAGVFKGLHSISSLSSSSSKI